jgi:hypothetical protein
MKLQKLGGYASIILVIILIVNIGILTAIFQGFTGLEIYDPAKMMAAYNASTIAFRMYYVLGVLTGVLIAFIALVLQERMQASAPQLIAITTEMTGIYRNVILSQISDPPAFRSFLVLHECLAGAAYNALGWGLLFIGCAVLGTRALPQMLGYITLLYGVAEIVVTVSKIELAIPIGLLLGIIVFAWLGVVLLREHQPNVAA